ncbi:Stk1 family PASTA domain-containing Ser/Thr kinase [Frankia sp. Cas4]|uniref:Stk1 family PASTA domain-containing Ser/Thr kinase n=1 Tax=Frankia sp. Cas4 TaxID=3073927 RepID=UPI002AD46CDA|nr:Stk1 family PASTA domain-containing Ser/Thr kinase [Frankia sp. Cas4]
MDATVTDPVIGRLLDGRYTAQERIAVGGMATVYVAHDNRLDRLVALKVMHPAFAHDQDFVRRFHREATAAARLNTPRAVSILDQGSDNGPHGHVIYLVMELVRGQTLRQHIGNRGRLTPAEAVEIIEPVLEALTAAHDAGLIHRDIKPENILLGNDGQVKVADFGLARPVNQATYAMTQGVVMGTVGYLAPEQVSDGSADTRSDIYAAGVVLYEMLTGQLPHSGSTPMSLAYQSVHGDVPAPSAAVPGIPAALDTLVLRATARDPNRRPADGAAMLDELRELAAYLPEPGQEPGPSDGYPDRYPDGTHPGLAAVDGSRATTGYERGGGDLHGLAPHYRRRSRWSVGRLVAIAVVTLIALVAVFAGARALSGPGTVRVPPLVGLDRATAERTLTEAGLAVVFDDAATSDTFTEGRVMEQNPASTAEVKPGSTVRVRLSLGKAKVHVPDVATLSVTEAQSRLTRQQLNVTPTPRQEANAAIAAGNVIRTDPAAGTELAQGTAVTLIVSTGPATVTMPYVIQLTFEQARSQLQALGLTVNRADINDDTVAAGSVVRTSPDPGQQVNRGSTVTLFVSKGPPDTGGGGNGGDGSGQLVDVPDVVGLKYQAAARVLQHAGLKAERDGIAFFGDTVKSMNPPAGSQVQQGTKVTLTVG